MADVTERRRAVLPRQITVLRKDSVGLRDCGGGELVDAGADGAVEVVWRDGMAKRRFFAARTVDADRSGRREGGGG